MINQTSDKDKILIGGEREGCNEAVNEFLFIASKRQPSFLIPLNDFCHLLPRGGFFLAVVFLIFFNTTLMENLGVFQNFGEGDEGLFTFYSRRRFLPFVDG